MGIKMDGRKEYDFNKLVLRKRNWEFGQNIAHFKLLTDL